MMKKLIGVLAAAGILTVLVFTVLHRNHYRSMWFGEETSLLDVFDKSDSVAAPLPEPSSVAEPDEMQTPDAPASDPAEFDRSVDSVALVEAVDSVGSAGSVDSADSSRMADRPEAMPSADSLQ